MDKPYDSPSKIGTVWIRHHGRLFPINIQYPHFFQSCNRRSTIDIRRSPRQHFSKYWVIILVRRTICQKDWVENFCSLIYFSSGNANSVGICHDQDGGCFVRRATFGSESHFEPQTTSKRLCRTMKSLRIIRKRRREETRKVGFKHV